MNLPRAAVIASVATVVCWLAKDIAIATAGGLNKSPLEGPFFLLGLLCCVVAGILVGVAAFADRGVGWRILGAVVAFVVLTGVGAVVQTVVRAVQPAHPSWPYAEVNLWATMLVLLAAALVVRRRSLAEPRSL